MLPHTDFYRRDAETLRKREKRNKRLTRNRFMAFSCSAFRLCVYAGILLAAACGSKPTDPRTVIPNDALVYLESNDLAKTLRSITDNPKFEAAAKSKPNVSALSGVRLSIAVTGFETSEQAVTEENSVLNFQPRFVAVVETNAWSWQTTSFVENQLGEFVNEVYGGDVEMEMTPRNDGKFYVWSAPEGRKAYALQQGSLIFFGNDETAIERCQSVKRGETESIAKNPKIADDGDRLAFGYVSAEGVGQIANIAGISLAMGASEEEEVKSFVARVLPGILRNSVKELTWTASKTDEGVEDKILIALDDESSRVFNETIVPTRAGTSELADFVPESAASATRYLLRDPQIAWRSVVLTARKKTDETSGGLIAAFSGSLFEPYGIEDPESFLSGVGPQLVTARLTPDSEDVVVIGTVNDVARMRKGIAKEINFGRPAEKQFGADVWKSEDGEVAAAFSGDKFVIGDAEIVLKCLEAKQAHGNAGLARQFASSDAASITVANEADSFGKLIDVLAERKNEDERLAISYRTETRFNKNGIERRTISDFGLIGWIIEHLAHE